MTPKGKTVPRKSFLIIGGGGHARVVIDLIQQLGTPIIGLTDTNSSALGAEVLGVPVLGEDDKISVYGADTIELAIGLGSIGNNSKRAQIFARWRNKGYSFPVIRHPFSSVARMSQLGAGVQIMAGAVIQTGSKVGENTVVNTNATVDHECELGASVFVSPGAVICGGVSIDSGVHVGAGAIIRQGIRVGANSLVAAGAVVVDNVLAGTAVRGVPAREFKL